VNLSAEDAADQLMHLKNACPRVVGVRYVVDYVGPFGEAPATHFFVSRHGPGGGSFGGGLGVDFLRDPVWAPRFERGFSALADVGLSFDLQCAPAQLSAAAALIRRHPRVRVCLDHMGKPRLGGTASDEAAELATWRHGMGELAALPNVFVKLSMLGYSVPGWAADASKEQALSALVRETIGQFGAERCMFSTNWWASGAQANSDGRDDVEISMADLWTRYHAWVAGDHTDGQVARLFAGTAEEFYRL